MTNSHPARTADQTRPAPRGPHRPHVIGLDLSLTSTGIAGTDWACAARPGTRRGHERMTWLLATIAGFMTQEPDLVVVEGPAYAQGRQAGHHELGGLWWLATHDLWRRGIPYAVANPHHRTIYATGRANPAQHLPRAERARAAKGMVRNAVISRYGIDCEGPGRYDQADAAILAAMGLDWLGHPTAPVPETHRRALETMNWPDPAP
ncbi:hypothetical protein [Streptomyces sp. NPDC014733]|uniref:hypothetical protein n=1 Tax=Streptomyces sp. NPDC014733 TaxID=3364885 RepID=UPI0036FF88B8